MAAKIKLGNVVGLFDGISCGQVALNRAGIEYEKYYASEIDTHAIKVTQHHYPNTIQLGDICQIDEDTLPDIDLLIGGSPCQGFSMAGKRLNFNDPRSKLFFEFVRILKACNPKYFLLENVGMKQEWQDAISKELGVQPIIINSNLVSAQNRKRLYWTNIPNIAQPTDKQLFWDSVFEENAKCYHYTQKALDWLVATDKRKKRYKVYHRTDQVKMQMIEASHHKLYSNQRCFSVSDNGGLRFISPLECERLQTLPDNYTSMISNTQRYKTIGNGWTVDVIAHIFSYMGSENNED